MIPQDYQEASKTRNYGRTARNWSGTKARCGLPKQQGATANKVVDGSRRSGPLSGWNSRTCDTAAGNPSYPHQSGAENSSRLLWVHL